MSDSLRQAIEEIQGQINERLKEVAGMKQAVNSLCGILKIDPIYSDTEQEQTAVSPARADAYYGKPLSTAAREYLEFRKQACAPEDILRGLEQGGFDFDALEWKGEHRLRSLSASLAKNTAVFRRLPNGMFGLKAWYQDAPPIRRRGKGKTDEGQADETQQTPSPQPEAAAQEQQPQSSEAEHTPAETGEQKETDAEEKVWQPELPHRA